MIQIADSTQHDYILNRLHAVGMLWQEIDLACSQFFVALIEGNQQFQIQTFSAQIGALLDFARHKNRLNWGFSAIKLQLMPAKDKQVCVLGARNF